MSKPVYPDYILAPGGGELCEVCGLQGATYMVSEGAWLCLDAAACTRRGLDQLMGPPPESYDVEIADWAGGKPLRLLGLAAGTAAAALEAARDWVNRQAGFEFCLSLPPGSRVFAAGGDVPLLAVGFEGPLPEDPCDGLPAAVERDPSAWDYDVFPP